MKGQTLVKRYAQGLLNVCKNSEEYSSLYTQLCDFAEYLTQEKRLNKMLATPFLPTSKKIKVMEEILSRTSPPQKISRFILLLIENDRWEILPRVIEIIPDLWNEERGIITFEVSSVIPLSDKQKEMLKRRLESMEKGPVALKYRENPTLIGGISLRKGNIVYDASVEGYLSRLQETIREG